MALSQSHRKLIVEPGKKPEPEKQSPCYMCYICPEDCYLSPSPPPPPPPPPQLPASPASQKHQISTILILMLCILSVAFLFLSYLTVRRYRSRNSRRRNLQALENGNFRQDFLDENQGPVLDHPIWYIRTVGLPQSAIDSISVFQYKKEDGLIDGRDCSVCLSEFEENESLRLLPKCSHAFHLSCIDTWLRSHMNCPVCRAPVLAPNVANTNNIQVSTVETSSTDSVEEDQAQTELETRSDETRENRGLPEIRCINGENFRVLSDLVDRRVKSDQELQQRVRRSFSMDISSSIMIYDRFAKSDEGSSDTKFEIVEKEKSSDMGCKNPSICRLIKSSSYRSLQKGPISMKRSFSFSGKRSLRKNSRSHESIPIPEISIQR